MTPKENDTNDQLYTLIQRSVLICLKPIIESNEMQISKLEFIIEPTSEFGCTFIKLLGVLQSMVVLAYTYGNPHL